MTLLTIPKELIKTIILELSDVSKLMLFMSCKFLSPLKKDHEPVIHDLECAILDDSLSVVSYFHETLHYPLETVEEIDLGYYTNSQWSSAIRTENKDVTKYLKTMGMVWDTSCKDWIGGSSLEYLQYCVEIGLEVDGGVLSTAVQDNKYDNVVYLTSLDIEISHSRLEYLVGYAVGNGNLNIVKHLEKNNALKLACPEEAYILPEHGSQNEYYRGTDEDILECLKYLDERHTVRYHDEQISEMLWQGKPKSVMFLCDKYTIVPQNILDRCANDISVLKYLHTQKNCTLTASMLRRTIKYDELESTRYLLDNNCPMPADTRLRPGSKCWSLLKERGLI